MPDKIIIKDTETGKDKFGDAILSVVGGDMMSLWGTSEIHVNLISLANLTGATTLNDTDLLLIEKANGLRESISGAVIKAGGVPALAHGEIFVGNADDEAKANDAITVDDNDDVEFKNTVPLKLLGTTANNKVVSIDVTGVEVVHVDLIPIGYNVFTTIFECNLNDGDSIVGNMLYKFVIKDPGNENSYTDSRVLTFSAVRYGNIIYPSPVSSESYGMVINYDINTLGVYKIKVKILDYFAITTPDEMYIEYSISGLVPATFNLPSQLQSDWNQTDNGAYDYIKNKPTTGLSNAAITTKTLPNNTLTSLFEMSVPVDEISSIMLSLVVTAFNKTTHHSYVVATGAPWLIACGNHGGTVWGYNNTNSAWRNIDGSGDSISGFVSLVTGTNKVTVKITLNCATFTPEQMFIKYNINNINGQTITYL